MEPLLFWSSILFAADSYAANLVINEGESVYDYCWYPYMSASGVFSVINNTSLMFFSLLPGWGRGQRRNKMLSMEDAMLLYWVILHNVIYVASICVIASDMDVPHQIWLVVYLQLQRVTIQFTFGIQLLVRCCIVNEILFSALYRRVSVVERLCVQWHIF